MSGENYRRFRAYLIPLPAASDLETFSKSPVTSTTFDTLHTQHLFWNFDTSIKYVLCQNLLSK